MPRIKQGKKIVETANKLDWILLNKNTSDIDRYIRLSGLVKSIDALSIDSNPFEWVVIDNDVSVALKSGFTNLNPDGTMFMFDSNFDLEENTTVILDPFFIREGGLGNDITVIEPETP